MAGLGRGLGALLSESSKVAQNRGENSVGEDLLRRSMTSESTSSMTPVMDVASDKPTTLAAETQEYSVSERTPEPADAVADIETISEEQAPLCHQEVLESVTAELKELSATTSATLENRETEATDEDSLATTISFESAPESKQIVLNNKPELTVPEDHVVHNILLCNIRPALDQPRKDFDEDSLYELAESIKEHGLLEPLLVKRQDDGFYEIICGERRYRAAHLAQLPTVPCLVRNFTPEKSSAIALIENIQRENLNPLEQAIAFKKMMLEHNMTQDALAKSLGKPRSVISNFIRLLSLEDEVKEFLHDGRISLGHAKVLLGVKGEQQITLCREIIEQNLNVRETEKLLKEYTASARKTSLRKNALKNKYAQKFKSYEKQIKENLPGVRAKFTITSSSRGRLVLTYASATELKSVLASLGVLEPEAAEKKEKPKDSSVVVDITGQ